MLGYTQIAVGLINLDYQRNKHLVLQISAIAVLVGLSYLALTFIPKFSANVNSKKIGYLLSGIAILVLGIQFLNI